MRPTTVARTVNAPVFSPATRAGATATPEALVVTAANLSPPVKVASVSPRTVKRIRTLPTAFPALVSARVLIFLSKVSPAIAVRPVVPAFSRWWTVSVGVSVSGGSLRVGRVRRAGARGARVGGLGLVGRGGLVRLLGAGTGRRRAGGPGSGGRARSAGRGVGPAQVGVVVAAADGQGAGAVRDLVGALAVVLQPGQDRVQVVLRVVVAEDRPVEVGLDGQVPAVAAQVVAGGEGGVIDVVRVLLAVGVAVAARPGPGGGDELHGPTALS